MNTEPAAPDGTDRMRRVSHEEFFAYVGKMNVHPCPEGRYDRVTGYRTEWRTCEKRRLMGISDGGTCLMPSRFWIGA
jgi:hypothetical protein